MDERKGSGGKGREGMGSLAREREGRGRVNPLSSVM